MYNFFIKGVENRHEYEELIKVFLPVDAFSITLGTAPEGELQFSFAGDRDQLKREIYIKLMELTGQKPKWGILTGIRPVKLTGELIASAGETEAREQLMKRYLLAPEKVQLLVEIYRYQQKLLGRADPQKAGVYIGIPFCPTRCLYCSFTSNQAGEGEIERYLEALFTEIDFAGKKMKMNGIRPESIYIGGGTPTALSAGQLLRLLQRIRTAFDFSEVREFTVEAGRPDTITREKLEVLKNAGAERISINPQTMKDETLQRIGREHTAKETDRAFKEAAQLGFDSINCDIIAGLPGETPEDFKRTLNHVMELGAGNITVHTLAVKRSSRLKEMDKDYNYKQAELVEQMIDHASAILPEHGYRPYYLYKQKHTSGSTENIGYCRDDKIGIYNVRIMEEGQSVIALGAGGMSKVYFPAENRLERVPNVSNYEIYIERLEEMLQRKRDNLFRR